MKKSLLLFVVCAIYCSGFSQTTKTVVESKVQFGHYFYYFLKSKTGNNIYKTSAFFIDELTVGQDVDLSERETEDDFDIIDPITQHPGMARRIKNNGNSIEARIERMDLPILENEILFFRDTTHLYSFYEQINEIEENVPFNNRDFEDVLDAFEDRYNGFYSFRGLLFDKYQDDMTDEEFLAFEEEDFIADRVHRSIFNSNRLLGIRGRVYYYHHFNEIVSTDKENLEEIELFKELSEDANSTIFNSSIVMNFNIEHEPNDRIDFKRWSSFAEWRREFDAAINNDTIEQKGVTMIQTSEGSLSHTTLATAHHIIDDCDKFTKGISIDDLIVQLNLEPVPSNFMQNYTYTLRVWWDKDNYPTAYVDYFNYNVGKGLNDPGDIVTHTYPESTVDEVFPVSELIIDTGLGFIVSVFDGKDVPMGMWYQFKFDLECTSSSAAAWKHTESGNWRLRSKIWFNSNPFGRHVGSYSQGYEKKNNKWKAKKSKIRTRITGQIRLTKCEVEGDPKTGQRNKNNAKEAKRSKSFLANRKRSLTNGDVTSTHRLQKGGVLIDATMILNPCP